VKAHPTYTALEFKAESRRIDTLIWEALCVGPGQRVLFCGYDPDATWVKRSIASGAQVTVIDNREEAILAFSGLGATFVRGSTSVIPARENAYDVAIAFHYLHETDPLFHAQIVSEMARVGRRVAIVEPAPPADPLGRQIASLYSQAKRELGQFEYYQPIEYWKKLLQAVKADVSQHVFAFAKVAPAEYVKDTVALLLATMAAEETPEPYLAELRAIAQRSDAPLLPPARFVLSGAALGDQPTPHFTARVEPEPEPVVRPVPVRIAPAQPVAQNAQRAVTPEAGWEFPPVEPPPAGVPQKAPSAPKPSPVPEPIAFGFGDAMPPGADQAPGFNDNSPFGAPFAVPEIEPAGWQWEPPERKDL
jgi:hypothetical protein